MDSTPIPEPADGDAEFTVDEGRALHPSSEPRPEQFRRCGRHWFDAALAGCDGCGAALCASCVVAVEGTEALCEACSHQRSATRRAIDITGTTWLKNRYRAT